MEDAALVNPYAHSGLGFHLQNLQKINLYYYEDNLQKMLMENLQLEILVRKQNK